MKLVFDSSNQKINFVDTKSYNDQLKNTISNNPFVENEKYN